MLYVIFYNVQDKRIENFKKMKWEAAVAISDEIEKACRQDKNKFDAEFQVIDDDHNIYYKGVFAFGSYDYQNVYHQVKEKSSRIKVSKEHQAEKQFLLEQLEQLTPEEYKKIEVVDKTFINLQKTNISKMKSWQRKLIYSLTLLSSIGVAFLIFLLSSNEDKYKESLAAEVEKNDIQTKLIELYEVALQGERTELLAFLENLSTSNELTESQRTLLINEYILNNEFEKAVTLDDDIIFIETLILSSKQLSDEEKAEKIGLFNNLYPTNEARFDLAYFEGDYELMLNVENVNMTIQRSEMKTYAFLKLGRIDEAKTELNNNSNAILEEKIVRYEVLAAELKTLKEKLELVSGAERTELEKSIAAKQKEIDSL